MWNSDKENLLRAVAAHGKKTVKNGLERIVLYLPKDERTKTYFIASGSDQDGDYVALVQPDPEAWPRKK